jgi:hypothetical protein
MSLNISNRRQVQEFSVFFFIAKISSDEPVSTTQDYKNCKFEC